MTSQTIKEGPFRIRRHIQDGKPSGKWQLDIPPHLDDEGRRRRLSFDTKTQAIADARERLRALSVSNGQLARARAKTGYTLNVIAARWTSFQEARVASEDKRANTLDIELHRLKSILAFLGSEDVGLIDPKRIEEFKASRRAEGRKAATINSQLSTLRAILNWAHDEGVIAVVPKIKQYPQVLEEPDLPTPEETARIIDHTHPKVRAFVHFVAETGCRKGEARNLRWENVDLTSLVVHIRPLERVWKPKNRTSQRTIPIGSRLAARLANLPRVGPYVFPGRDDPTKPLDNCRKALAGAVKRAKVLRNGKPLKVGLHKLRKAYASALAAQRVDESVLQKLLGHAPGSTVTRRIYVQANRQAVETTKFELPFCDDGADEQLAKSGNRRA